MSGTPTLGKSYSYYRCCWMIIRILVLILILVLFDRGDIFDSCCCCYCWCYWCYWWCCAAVERLLVVSCCCAVVVLFVVAAATSTVRGWRFGRTLVLTFTTAGSYGVALFQTIHATRTNGTTKMTSHAAVRLRCRDRVRCGRDVMVPLVVTPPTAAAAAVVVPRSNLDILLWRRTTMGDTAQVSSIRDRLYSRWCPVQSSLFYSSNFAFTNRKKNKNTNECWVSWIWITSRLV